MAWVWLAGAICLEVVATLNLKVSEGFTRFWPSVVVVLGYIGSFSLLGATLKRLDVGTVYAIWSGAGTVVVVFVGIMLFGESAGGSRLLGIGVITVGVIVLNLSGGGHGGEGHAEAKAPPEEPQSEPGAAAARHAAEPVAHVEAFVPRQRPGKHAAPPKVTSVRAFVPASSLGVPDAVSASASPARRAAPTNPRGVARIPAQQKAKDAADTSATISADRGAPGARNAPVARSVPEAQSASAVQSKPEAQSSPEARSKPEAWSAPEFQPSPGFQSSPAAQSRIPRPRPAVDDDTSPRGVRLPHQRRHHHLRPAPYDKRPDHRHP